jgi:hypothetical protein
MNFSDFEKQLKELASVDGSFRKMLLENPKKAIMEKMNLTTPEGIRINVIEDTSSTINLVLPSVFDASGVKYW